MKKFVKIILVIIIIIAVGIGGILIYITSFLPNIKADDNLVIELTPDRIERGRYLANELMGCVGCHGRRDYNKFAGPIIKGSKGSGGEHFGHELGFPGEIYAPNITPTYMKDWTDGELYRAITCGVDKDGNALFPVMPYLQYGKLPREDIYSVIAYIRTLQPTIKEYPKHELDFPLNILVHTMPKEGPHNLKPDDNDMVKHGEYIVTAATCYDCHTPMEKGKYNDEMAFSGGVEFHLPTGGIVRSANITPDKDTGIGNWTEEEFVRRFKIFADSNYVAPEVHQGDFNTYMPWEYYSQIKERDLRAVYAYLMSRNPVKKKVVKFTPQSD